MNNHLAEHLHEQNIATLDEAYADLLRLARQGNTPGVKEQLLRTAELRARISGDKRRLAEQRREIDALPS